MLPLPDVTPRHGGLCTEEKPNLIQRELKERETEKEENRKSRSKGGREEKKNGRKGGRKKPVQSQQKITKKWQDSRMLAYHQRKERSYTYL